MCYVQEQINMACTYSNGKSSDGKYHYCVAFFFVLLIEPAEERREWNKSFVN